MEGKKYPPGLHPNSLKNLKFRKEERHTITPEERVRGKDKANETKRTKKLLREELREILSEETTKGSGITKQRSLIQNVLKNILNKGGAKDLKALAEILGELEININMNQTERPSIDFGDE